MIFRKALSEDKKEIAELYRSVIGTPCCTWNRYYPGETEFMEDLDNGNLFVLTNDGMIVGTVSIVSENEMDDFSFWKHKDKTGEFARVAVLPAYQNRGYGRILVENIIEEFRKRNVKTIHISVAKINTYAQKLYRSLGFEFVGECHMYDNDYYLCERAITKEKSSQKADGWRITEELFKLKDEEYASFSRSLIPDVPDDYIIGVRVPLIRKLVKEYKNDPEAKKFLNQLPHRYHEENLVHGFLIESMNDYDECIRYMDAFLPYVRNWADCDSIKPRVFRKHKEELMGRIREWMKSDQVYVCRFSIEMLMNLYLDDDFKSEYLEMVSKIRSDEYYLNMMIAWYFATALAKQWDETIRYIEENRLDVWTHNKTIQKARESYRITEEQKEYLKTLKRNK